MKIISMFQTLAALMLLSATALAADGIRVEDAYIRSSTAKSTSAAAFMVVINDTDADDRLIAASSDVAEAVEMHSHSMDANGVMRMGEIEGGVPIAQGESHIFDRGGDHLMFMGLSQPLVQGDMIKVTLEFESAGAVDIDVPVDRARKPTHATATD